MLIADGEGGAECYSVATKKDQAKITFNESLNMVRQSPYLSKYLKKRLYITNMQLAEQKIFRYQAVMS